MLVGVHDIRHQDVLVPLRSGHVLSAVTVLSNHSLPLTHSVHWRCLYQTTDTATQRNMLCTNHPAGNG